MKIRFFPTSCIAVASALLTITATFAAPQFARFDPFPENPVPELQKVEALQVKVSLEAKRTPLSELLATLQQQSGVALQSAADFPATKTLVTLRVREMPLASLMGTLSRIYGVSWKAENGGWLMQPTDKSALELKLRRATGLLPEADVERREIVKRQQDEQAQDIYFSVDENVWLSPQNVKFTDLPERLQRSMLVNQGVAIKNLPPEMQQAIRRHVDSGEWSWLIERQTEKAQLQGQRLVLRLGKIPADTPVLFGREYNAIKMLPREYAPVQLAVYTADGRFVTNVFRTFRPASAPDEAQKEPQPQAEIPVPDGR